MIFPLRKRTALLVLLFSVQGIMAHRAVASPEIVVAIRYLRPSTTSHGHLYLFREDGRLLRQLTQSDAGQDKHPVFSPDGKSIVFTRELPHGKKQVWSITPLGKKLKNLKIAPAWYSSTKTSPFFTNLASPSGTPRLRAPDGSVEVELRLDKSDEDDKYNLPRHGKHYILRNLKTKKEWTFGKLPGFQGAYDILHRNKNIRQHFLFAGALRVAFFDLHLNSTDGTTVYALDLANPRLVRLSPNWATPVPLPGQAAFLTFTENRYVPIRGSKKTANSSYIERWDNKLKRIRYGRNVAAVCYGASLYRPDQTPRIVNIRDDGA